MQRFRPQNYGLIPALPKQDFQENFAFRFADLLP
jgi:hypothetical protein